MDLDRLMLAVHPEYLGPSRGWAGQPEQQPHGGRLSRPVRPEVPDNFALCDLEVQVFERIDGTVALGQVLGPHSCCCHRKTSLVRGLYVLLACSPTGFATGCCLFGRPAIR